MDDNQILSLLLEIKEELAPYLGLSGSVFYAGRRAMKRGNFYLMGLNPGGDLEDEAELLLGESLSKWEKDGPDWSAYVHENWTKTIGREGAAQHQRNIRYLCEEVLKEDIANVFSANAIFLRSKNSGKLNASGELLVLCRKLHFRFLREVKPRVVICLGNGSGSSFELARKWFGSTSRIETAFCGYRGRGKGRAFIRWFDCLAAGELSQNNKFLRVIGLPHPSRYWYKSLESLSCKVTALTG